MGLHSDNTIFNLTIRNSIIHSKIESYLQLLQSPGEAYPANLKIYVKQSLQDYTLFMKMYEQWELRAEQSGEKAPPIQMVHS